MTTTYWTPEKNQVVCGCFVGTVDEFAAKVKETHGNNEHGKAYRKYIRHVRMLMKGCDK